MRVALLSLFVVVMSLSAEARPGRGRPGNDFDFGRPGFQSCTATLEKKFDDWSTNYYFVDSFTEYGPNACLEASETCETEKFGKWDSWKYRCVVERPTRPTPAPVPSCTYQIEAGRRGNRRLVGQPFHAIGFNACRFAQLECEDELDQLRRFGRVGPFAECVQVSGGGRPDPRPITYTRSCTAELIAGRVGRPTGNIFQATATARSSSEAEQRACNDALAQCRPFERGSLRCQIR